MAHVQGASRIMETLRPISSQPQTPLSACLMSHFRTSSVGHTTVLPKLAADSEVDF